MLAETPRGPRFVCRARVTLALAPRAGLRAWDQVARQCRAHAAHLLSSLPARRHLPAPPSCLGRSATVSGLRDIPAGLSRVVPTRSTRARARPSGPDRPERVRFAAPGRALRRSSRLRRSICVLVLASPVAGLALPHGQRAESTEPDRVRARDRTHIERRGANAFFRCGRRRLFVPPSAGGMLQEQLHNSRGEESCCYAKRRSS